MIKYAITDPTFFNPKDSTQAKDYFKNLKADIVLYRDKKTQEYQDSAKIFMEFSKKFNFKGFLHQDYRLANQLNANGVHLTSMQFNQIADAKRVGLFVTISTHSIKEIERAKRLGADAVTFSPIFKTPNKGEPKGIESLKRAVECCGIKVIALGGIISNTQVQEIKTAKPWGFASIRYFTKKWSK